MSDIGTPDRGQAQSTLPRGCSSVGFSNSPPPPASSVREQLRGELAALTQLDPSEPLYAANLTLALTKLAAAIDALA